MTNASTARTRELGQQAALIRQAAGLTGQALSARIGCVASSVSRFEAGMSTSMSEIRFIQYLSHCGLTDQEIAPLVRTFRSPDTGFHVSGYKGLPDDTIALVMHETTARTIHEYENTVIPGLLQSADYARALLQQCGRLVIGTLDEGVQIRMDRQSVLSRRRPPRADFFIAEAALRTMVGGYRIMTEQMMKLQFATDWDNCTVRVIPTSAAGQLGDIAPFRLMGFADHGPVAVQDLLAAMAFLESPDAIALYRDALERIGRLALPLKQSRAFITRLADEYDRLGAEQRDAHGAAGYVVDVAEE